MRLWRRPRPATGVGNPARSVGGRSQLQERLVIQPVWDLGQGGAEALFKLFRLFKLFKLFRSF